MRPADDEHREGAAVYPDRHPQHHVAVAGPRPADLTQPAPHRRRGAVRPLRMLLVALLVIEHQHHRVAAELHKRSTACIGLG